MTSSDPIDIICAVENSLYHACTHGAAEAIQQIFGNVPESPHSQFANLLVPLRETTPLHLATQSHEGHLDAVTLLLKRGAVVDEVINLTTPLLETCIHNSHPDVIEALIVSGANVNFSDPSDGQTPILSLSGRNFCESLMILLHAGVNINAQRTDCPGTILHKALQYEPQLAEIQLLLLFRADPNLKK